MEDLWAQIGVGGTIAYLILKEVFNFLKPVLARRKGSSIEGNGQVTDSRTLAKIRTQVGDMHRLHAQVDTDGTPLIYVPRSLGTAIDNLAKATSEQTTVLSKLGHDVEETRRDVREVRSAIVGGDHQ